MWSRLVNSRRMLATLFVCALAIAFAPPAPAADLSYAVLFSADQGVGVWNARAEQASKRINRVDGAWDPVALAAHPDGRRVFALDRSSGEIVVIDRIARKMLGRHPRSSDALPRSMLLSPSGGRLYVVYAKDFGTELVTLDTRGHTLTVLHRLVMFGGGDDAPLAISKDGSALYLGRDFDAAGSPFLIGIFTNDRRKVAPTVAFTVSGLPFHEVHDLAVSRNGRVLWLAGLDKQSRAPQLASYDLFFRKIQGTLALDAADGVKSTAVQLRVSPVAETLYAITDGRLQTVRPDMTTSSTIPFGALDYSRRGQRVFGLSPDGDRGYLLQDGAVRVVNLRGARELQTLQVPSARQGVIAVSSVGEVTAKVANVSGETWSLGATDLGWGAVHEAHRFDFGHGKYPLLCDWDGDGVKTPGVFDAATSEWTITNTLPPSNPITFKFGFGPSDWPVCGDWNGDGTQTVGVVNNRIMWHLRNSNSAGAADVALSFDVPLGWRQPIAGDWDGNGTDTPGYFYGATAASANEWFLKNDLASGRWHQRFVYNPCLEQGKSGCAAIVGDWTGAGFTSVGVVADEPSQVTRNWMLRHSLSSGQADNTFLFGPMKGRALTWR